MPGVISLQPLAAGGNSTVYRAWQPELDRWVAVKVLGVTLSEARARDRFLRECSAVGRLTGHPNIVTVLGSGVTRTNRPFLTMDLFERGSLGDLVDTGGPVAVDLALRYGVKLAGALETAHRAGILHRDLKPENVLLSRFGEPGLADFGIATLGEARGGTEAFTATHAAPEVLDGRQATVAADVYGLGSTLWTALAGRLPFGDGSEGPLKLMLRVLQEPLPPLGREDVPIAVEESLRWAMAKDPADRPASAVALGERLRSLQAELGFPVSELVVPDDLSELRPGPQPEPHRARSTGPAPPDDSAATIRPARAAAGGPVRRDPPVPAGAAGGPGPGPRPVDEAVEPGRRQPRAWEPRPGPPPDDLAATIVRPRPPITVPPPDPAPRAPARRGLATAIIAVALLLTGSLVAGVAIVTRNGGDAPQGGTVPMPTAPPTTPAQPAVPVPTSTAPSSSTTTLVDSRRTPAKVVVRLVDPLRAVVGWEPPPDRGGLLGYVVAFSPRMGAVQVTSQAVNDPTATQATVALSGSGSRCFIVQAVYVTGGGTSSEPVCT